MAPARGASQASAGIAYKGSTTAPPSPTTTAASAKASADGTRTTYTYNAADQLSGSNTTGTLTTYTFDSAGNLQVEWVGVTRTTHTWDEGNRLTQVQKTGMTTNAYTFNRDGQRVRIVDSLGTRRLIWEHPPEDFRCRQHAGGIY